MVYNIGKPKTIRVPFTPTKSRANRLSMSSINEVFLWEMSQLDNEFVVKACLNVYPQDNHYSYMSLSSKACIVLPLNH